MQLILITVLNINLCDMISGLDIAQICKKDSIVSVLVAFGLHALIAISFIVCFDDNLLRHDYISNVSIVSSNSSQLKKSNPEQSIQISALSVSDSEFLFNSATGLKSRDAQSDNSSQSTSDGVSKSDATNQASAESEPIYNAEYLNNQPPSYPSQAKKDGVQGKVLLVVSVLENGLVADVSVSETSGYSILDNAAKNAVKGWNFIPAKRSGQAVVAKVIVPIEFKLS